VTTNSMMPSLSYASIAVGLFKAATIAVTTGELAAATACLEGIDDLSLRNHFDLAIAEWGNRNKSAAWKYVDVPRGVKLNMPGVATERAVFRRDSWRCRWCETPVIYGAALKRMGRELPTSFSSGSAIGTGTD
jgi:hypothetical protein